MDERDFGDLLTRYFDGLLEQCDVERLLKAVELSPDFRRRFQDEARLHVLLRESMSEQAEVNLIQESMSPSPVTPNRAWFGWLVLANAAVLIIAAGLYLWSTEKTNNAPSFGTCVNVSGNSVVQVRRGDATINLNANDQLHVGDRVVCDAHARALLKLNDGSILSLDKGTQLTLVSDRPELRLEQGEATFEVAKRSEGSPPFQVHTSQSTVDVMGTVFGLVDDGQTELEVYEGLVSMIRHRDRKRVEVGSLQTASTGDETFSARELTANGSRTINLLPSDDVTLDRGVPAKNEYRLKVEADRRLAYLRFVIPELTNIKSAKLSLTQEIDTGSGRLRLDLAEHSKWTSETLTEANAPQPVRVLDEHQGVVTHGQVVEFDVSNAVGRSGPVTFILTLDRSGENDIWFSSRIGPSPPQLILSVSNDKN